jgi:beta-glucosidase
MSDHALPYFNTGLTVEERVDDLLSRMTVEEKIAQIYQIWILPENTESSKEFIRKYGVGSRILAGSNLGGNSLDKAAEVVEVNEYQRIAVEQSRLGIPILFGRDVIHGFRTIFPIPLGMAASWDPDLLEQTYVCAAREAKSAGVNWAFAPMLDIARDPRWGRIAEGSGEDPYLGSKMAAAAVRGFQGKDLADPEHLLACAKHYIGYGAAEGGRDYNTSEISDNTLRNIYLPPFKAAVDAGLGSIMSGFHDLNGESVSASHYLLTDLLKGELGFSGCVISDWGSVWDLIHHRLAEDERDAARLGFNSGVDMEMVTSTYVTHMKSLLEAGEVSTQRLDDACRRILTLKFRMGLFERPYVDEGLADKVQFTSAHTALARKMAARSLVLLKNDGNLLPLPKEGMRIALMGPLTNQRTALLGSWTLDGLISETQNLYEAFSEAAPKAVLPHISDSLADEMLRAAMHADVVVFAAGESNIRSGENNNVAEVNLPAGQEDLIEAICALGKPVVVLVFAGRALNLSRITRCADAILYAWHPGSKGAAAVADVVFGDVSPVGKLPVSLPRSTGQIPIHYNFKSTGHYFDAIGRQTSPGYAPIERYLDLSSTPLYPFGFGLGYTQFSYDTIRVSHTKIKPGETLSVSAQITNTGSKPGEEIAQCYVQDCVASTTRPVRELKGFKHITLQPGQSARITFNLGYEELSFYALDGKRRLEPGKFKAWVGGSCLTNLEVEFTVVSA